VVNGRLVEGDHEGNGTAVVFTRGGVFPWTAMTREQYLRARIFGFEGKDGATLKEISEKTSKTPYEEWMSGAAQRMVEAP
jgi:hypothetical protein